MSFFTDTPERRKLIPFVIFVALLLCFRLRGYIMTLNYSFNGMIENVQYSDPKHIPTITVHGKEYDLIYCNWKNYNDTLSVGDSVVKIRGQVGMLLIKK